MVHHRQILDNLSVCVLEKGAEVGAHVLSGNVFEPRALDELIPEWRQEDAPIRVPVSSDKFWMLTKNKAWTLPSPFDNKGNYVISLSQLVRWMSVKAEELGVEVYPGFAASEILYDENQIVTGVATNDVGIAKDGSKRETFQSGLMEVIFSLLKHLSVTFHSNVSLNLCLLKSRTVPHLHGEALQY
ncbi:electron transfer flavoprotein-ubiquinone oxidoreductase, mitochondrial-like [Hordeum vulgare subsp. vulgare]|uniref:electron transfer flavoprotein-ubiquinone oxidoreductase, mitochondrial-like n=1 Tax=Hordeum vulgare subsp. vulgare TaxID=112509 RepID=UPI001D1A43F5|nr:electron transfer flavoprotein-ubiquinone oxidoreductase, mitochondrial-like [Hordeum vulgare subsp. vulgare]